MCGSFGHHKFINLFNVEVIRFLICFFFLFFSLHFRFDFYREMSVTIKIRSRLSSVGDSAPPSESSDGSTSETYEHGASDWHQTDHHHHHQTQIMTSDSIYSGSGDSNMLSPDLGGAINENERVQVESFFSGLGTEVSDKWNRTIKIKYTHIVLSMSLSLSLPLSMFINKTHERVCMRPRTLNIQMIDTIRLMLETSSYKKYCLPETIWFIVWKQSHRVCVCVCQWTRSVVRQWGNHMLSHFQMYSWIMFFFVCWYISEFTSPIHSIPCHTLTIAHFWTICHLYCCGMYTNTTHASVRVCKRIKKYANTHSHISIKQELRELFTRYQIWLSSFCLGERLSIMNIHLECGKRELSFSKNADFFFFYYYFHYTWNNVHVCLDLQRIYEYTYCFIFDELMSYARQSLIIYTLPAHGILEWTINFK